VHDSQLRRLHPFAPKVIVRPNPLEQTNYCLGKLIADEKQQLFCVARRYQAKDAWKSTSPYEIEY
jgi:hypothetical protein